jgi:hypothetical protein
MFMQSRKALDHPTEQKLSKASEMPRRVKKRPDARGLRPSRRKTMWGKPRQGGASRKYLTGLASLIASFETALTWYATYPSVEKFGRVAPVYRSADRFGSPHTEVTSPMSSQPDDPMPDGYRYH